MSVVGADLQTLVQMYKGLGDLATEATDMKTKGDGYVHQANWTGHNADKFREAWAEFSKAFPKLEAALTDGQKDVKVQATNIAHATGEAPPI